MLEFFGNMMAEKRVNALILLAN